MARKGSMIPSSSEIKTRTLVVDPGAYTLKAGFSSTGAISQLDPSTDCNIIPNCVARSHRDKCTYIGSQLDSCPDFGEVAFRRPVEKGFVVNWEGEKAIWENEFFRKSAPLECDPHETNLIMTEAPNAPSALQRNADEMVFEEFEFTNYYRTIAPTLSAYAPSPFPNSSSPDPGLPLELLLLVDTGHSHTTVTPLYHGRPIHTAARRLEIGGKTLTNHLKDLLSTRQFDLRKEDYMAAQIKEDTCFISSDFTSDLERVWRSRREKRAAEGIVVDYVLPDYEDIKRGFARPHDPSLNARKRALGLDGTGTREDFIVLGNERFSVPEIIFTPTDIGMQAQGLTNLILSSLSVLPPALRQAYLANVAVVGGSSLIPGFTERLEAELRAAVEDDVFVRVSRAGDPVRNAWLGGARLARNEANLKELVVSRAEYLENGDLWVRRRFAGKVGR